MEVRAELAEVKVNNRRETCYLLNGKACLSGSPFVHSVVRLGVNLTSVTVAVAADVDNDDDNDVLC